MTKKGPLSKAEKFYIENHRDFDIKNLCRDLDRAQSIIKTFVNSLPEQQKETPLYKQFARNDKGATVMTEGASSMADDKRSTPNKQRPSCVTSIKK
jgi:hypothetical protein